MTRIFLKHKIKRIGTQVGRINLVKYSGQTIPHIEFEIDEALRCKGIMSKELPKYLKKCKDFGALRLLAMVKHDNIASAKLLEKNNFIKLATLETTYAYVLALDLWDGLTKFHKEVLKNLKND